MVLTATGYVPIEAGTSPSPAGRESNGVSAAGSPPARESMLPRRSDEAMGKYSPAQPRVPAGNPHGGEWTADSAQLAASDLNDATSILRPRGGHHFVPRAVYDDLPLKPETRKVFDDARTGSLKATRHGWSPEHAAYNQAVAEALKKFLARDGMQPQDMTPQQALQFVFEVIGSSDPHIRNLNLTLYRREMMHYIIHHMLLTDPLEGPLEMEGGSDD